jgi:hypothetical protein
MNDFIKARVNQVKTLVTTNPKDLIKKLTNKTDSFAFHFRQFLEKYGNETIHSLAVVRIPLSSALKIALNVASGFTFYDKLKQEPYDDLFHLGLIINNKYMVEKTNVVSIGNYKAKPKSETEPVNNIPPNLTINDLIMKTKDYMGTNNFFNYSAKHNNCQVFVNSILKANNLEDHSKFIMQDVTNIFANNTLMRKVVNTVTDIGNQANILLEGQGIGSTTTRKRKTTQKIPKTKLKAPERLNTLTNLQLTKLGNQLDIPIKKICMKDEFNYNEPDGCYIINLQNHNQNGTHWVCFVKHQSVIYYHDSFGMPCPQNEMDIFNKECDNIYMNTFDKQDINSNSCGYWCLAFLHHLTHNKGSYLQKFKSFNKMFNNKDPRENEKKLKIYIDALF